MPALPADGAEITTGEISRPQDGGGISALLKSVVSPERAVVNPRDESDRTFGLCELDVARMRGATNHAVRVVHTGRGHVRIFGCESEEVRQILANLAVVVIRPGYRL